MQVFIVAWIIIFFVALLTIISLFCVIESIYSTMKNDGPKINSFLFIIPLVIGTLWIFLLLANFTFGPIILLLMISEAYDVS